MRTKVTTNTIANDQPPLDTNTEPAPAPQDQLAARFAQFVADDDEAALLGGKPVQTNIPIGSPPKQSAVSFSPDPDYRARVMAYVSEDGDGGMDRVYYLILSDLAALVPESCRPVQLVPYVNAAGTVRLWPISLKATARGELSAWAESALAVVNDYAGTWIRVAADKGSSGYLDTPMRVPAPPKWPDLTIWELVDKAFGKRQITSRDHPILVDQLGLGDGSA